MPLKWQKKDLDHYYKSGAYYDSVPLHGNLKALNYIFHQ